MSLFDDLQEEVTKIVRIQPWTISDGLKIPSVEDVALGNKGTRINATILYADLAKSTSLVDDHSVEFAAEVYKTYLLCCVRIIRYNGGKIASFDGDRVMGVFHGDAKETSAVMAALQINGALIHIINPTLKGFYTETDYELKAACGVDTSDIVAARAGIRSSSEHDNNDLVWIGKAANHAAKLCSLREEPYSTWITSEVYYQLDKPAWDHDGLNMWEESHWADYDRTVFRSSYWWRV